MHLIHKMLGGMANRVDVDWTVPSETVLSMTALFEYAILSEILVYEI